MRVTRTHYLAIGFSLLIVLSVFIVSVANIKRLTGQALPVCTSVTPPITNGSGALAGTFSAGSYTITYVSGAMCYNCLTALNTNPLDLKWFVNYSAPTYAFYVKHSGTVETVAPGNFGQNPVESTAFASLPLSNRQITIVHTGGPISMFLKDAPYTDNLTAPGGTPTYEVCPVAASSSSASSASSSSSSAPSCSPACDDGNPCTNNICTAGSCSYPAVADGTSCTTSEVPSDGMCLAGICKPPPTVAIADRTSKVLDTITGSYGSITCAAEPCTMTVTGVPGSYTAPGETIAATRAGTNINWTEKIPRSAANNPPPSTAWWNPFLWLAQSNNTGATGPNPSGRLYQPTVTVTDALGRTASKQFNWQINPLKADIDLVQNCACFENKAQCDIHANNTGPDVAPNLSIQSQFNGVTFQGEGQPSEVLATSGTNNAIGNGTMQVNGNQVTWKSGDILTPAGGDFAAWPNVHRSQTKDPGSRTSSFQAPYSIDTNPANNGGEEAFSSACESKTVSPTGPVCKDDNLLYVMAIGKEGATSFNLTDVLDPCLDPMTVNAIMPSQCTRNGATIQCNNAAIPQTGVATVSFTVKAKADCPVGSIIKNKATATIGNDTLTTNETQNRFCPCNNKSESCVDSSQSSQSTSPRSSSRSSLSTSRSSSLSSRSSSQSSLSSNSSASSTSSRSSSGSSLSSSRSSGGPPPPPPPPSSGSRSSVASSRASAAPSSRSSLASSALSLSSRSVSSSLPSSATVSSSISLSSHQSFSSLPIPSSAQSSLQAFSSLPLALLLPSSSSASFSSLALTPSSPPDRSALCGNVALNVGEECDDGNRQDFDGCSSQCFLERGRCGDGIVQSLFNEQCEPSLESPFPCNAGTCRFQLATCGNNTIDGGEACDDGSNNSNLPTARCRPDCSLPRCGDSIRDTIEACDDGNRMNGDGCTAQCILERQAAQQPAQTLPASVFDLPSQPQQIAQQQPAYILPAQAYVEAKGKGPTTTDSGPETILLMAAGAASGLASIRRRRR